MIKRHKPVYVHGFGLAHDGNVAVVNISHHPAHTYSAIDLSPFDAKRGDTGKAVGLT
jgi:predicted NodU family carbamoyl transferase